MYVAAGFTGDAATVIRKCQLFSSNHYLGMTANLLRVADRIMAKKATS
jgi:hypothetical protein